MSGEIGVRAYVSEPIAHKQVPDGRSLLPAMLEQQPTVRLQMSRRVRDDVLQCFQTRRAGDQRNRGLLFAHLRIEIRVRVGDVGRIRHDEIEALVCKWSKPLAV